MPTFKLKSDFTRRNVIAAEIEKVIDALTSRSFNRADTLIAAPSLAIAKLAQIALFVAPVWADFYP